MKHTGERLVYLKIEISESVYLHIVNYINIDMLLPEQTLVYDNYGYQDITLEYDNTKVVLPDDVATLLYNAYSSEIGEALELNFKKITGEQVW